MPFFAIGQDDARHIPMVDQLGLEVSGNSREFAFTNKESGFIYGETNDENRSSWQGFNVFGHEFLDDYALVVDGALLQRSEILKTIVYPDFLLRIYPGGIAEEVRPIDSLSAFAVVVFSETPVELGVIPYFSDARDEMQLMIELRSELALVAHNSHLERTDEQNYPVWLAVHGKGFLPQLRNESSREHYSPVWLYAGRQKVHTVVFGVADSRDHAKRLVRELARDPLAHFERRRQRMEKLLHETLVITGDPQFNKALAWAKLSLDALIMNQVGRGIFAGLPWFNSYWGRDTFISLPGACLVTGRFHLAKEILLSFAEFQQRDSQSTDYGRLPNIVTTTHKTYNTADGTPRFVVMAREYTERSGDTTFLAQIYPVVVRSIDGTLRYHTDSLGFLSHGDAETWMDAVGPEGPWSPRGNRANDIQALWVEQLEAGAWFATRVGDAHSARAWTSIALAVRGNFKRLFAENGHVVDHLNANGSRDSQIRPNRIFTAPLLDEETRARVLQTVVTKLTYEHGVSSLWQEDPDFHPYHEFSPNYPKDAAYHNGAVWTWLQGPVVSELVHFGRSDVAYQLTQNAVHQILDRGAVGTQSELLDAVPRPGEREPRTSGTFSQAWNLAEFIRNFYDDYLGVRINRLNHEFLLSPRLPEKLGNVRATINLDGRAVPIQIDRGPGTQTIHIDGTNLRVEGTVVMNLLAESGELLRSRHPIRAGSKLTISVRGTETQVVSEDGRIVRLSERHRQHESAQFEISLPEHHPALDSLEFQKPKIIPGLKAMAGPDHTMLSHAQIKYSNPDAQIVFENEDPPEDDNGPGTYTYPLHPYFISGCLDLLRFSVSVDHEYAYFALRFRALANPGWHPEYGFQLTYAAIAIDEDQVPGSGETEVPYNAGYSVAREWAYEKFVLVGGGIRIESADRKILAEYVPSPNDTENPFGDSSAGTVSFAIPMSILGHPDSSWRFTVLVGAQDDHGGAGLGEFRAVESDRGEWYGGGKTRAGDSNIYDVLLIPSR